MIFANKPKSLTNITIIVVHIIMGWNKLPIKEKKVKPQKSYEIKL